MATRAEIDGLSDPEIEKIHKKVCLLSCEGDRFFDKADCRYVCPDFKTAVDRHLEAKR